MSASQMIEPITLQIHNADGRTIGTGFLVAKDLAVTCAHVIVDADAHTDDIVQVQFTGRDEKINALVMPEYWLDIDKGDVAVLKLESVPEGFVPLRLAPAAYCHSGNPFFSFGYAMAADVQGIIARGTIDGYLPQHKLLQLQAPQASHGISGAPVLDEKRGVVVGMITKGHTDLGRNEESTFATPAELFFDICPEIRPSVTCPYLGLETFTNETAHFFFGREALTEKLLGVLRSGCRFLAVFGPSGSGKSSVVQAGLLPELKNGQLPGSQKWTQIAMRPAENPFEQMKTEGLDPIDINGYLKSYIGMERVVLFIDQFEELFTLCPDDIRGHFIRDLATALENSRLILILSMRDDFYSVFNAKASPLAESEHLKIENVPGTLKRDELVAMIEGPAEAVDLMLEEGLTELILNDLTRDGEARSSALPLLEFALTQLWEKRRDGWLTHESYQLIGSVTGSLARWADDAYSDLPKADQPLSESLLTSLVHLGDEVEGLPDTRRRRTLIELGMSDSVQRVIKHFTDRRLLVTSGETVELIHDALVREWGRLVGWLANNRQILLWRQKMAERLREWEKGTGELLRGRELAEAQGFLKEHNIDLQELSEYIRLSVSRQRRQRNLLIGIITVTLVILGFLAVWGQSNAINAGNQAATAQANANVAETSQADALEQSNISRSRELAASAISQLQIDPEISLLLALEANKLARNPQTEEALRQSLIESRLIAVTTGHDRPVYDAVYSPDGKYFVTASKDHTARIWDAQTNQIVGLPLEHECLLDEEKCYVERVTISSVCPDGHQYVVTADRDGTARIWDLKTGELVNKFSGGYSPGWEMYGIAISPDCQYLATAGEHGLATLWAFPDIRLSDNFEHEETINTIRFSADGKFLLSASNDSTARIWEIDPSNPSIDNAKLVLRGHKGTVYAATFSPDGRYIATASQDKTARLWLAKNGELIRELRGHTNWVFNAEFSLDQNFVVTVGADGTVRLWSAFLGVQLAELQGHGGPAYSADFSPDGNFILTTSEDMTARVWAATRTVMRFSMHTNWVRDVDFSRVNQLVVTAGWDNQAVIRSIDDPSVSKSLPHENRVNSANFSPDGYSVVTAGRDGTVRIWDVRSGKLLNGFIQHTSMVNTAKYSSDGQYIVTSSVDNNARIWNATNGELLLTILGPELQIEVNDASFSPNNEYVVTAGGDGIARVWKFDKSKSEITDPIFELGGHLLVLSSTYSHNGKYILTSGGDNKARIWDATSGEIVRTLSGHNDLVYNASFDINDQFIVTAGGDGKAIVWDVSTGKKLAEFRDHAGPVMDASFSPDGKYVITASQDYSAYLYICDMCGSMDNILALAQTRVTRDLDCLERQIYLHEVNACPTTTKSP